MDVLCMNNSYPIMATFPICAEQGDIGSGFGMELEKPQYYWKRLLRQSRTALGKLQCI